MRTTVINHILRLIVCCVCITTVMDVAAAGVNAIEARDKAWQFLNNRQGAKLMPSSQQLKLAHAEMSKVDTRLADFYVFNADDGSAFVIVAGDDRAADVLAYGSHAIDLENLPCNMQWMLDHYKQQMDFLHSHPDVSLNAASRQNSVVVPPLISCTWNQRSPFYNQCPTSGTQHCLTGCVATAMAQVDVLLEISCNGSGYGRICLRDKWHVCRGFARWRV